MSRRVEAAVDCADIRRMQPSPKSSPSHSGSHELLVELAALLAHRDRDADSMQARLDRLELQIAGHSRVA
jgi:hypothetical protein